MATAHSLSFRLAGAPPTAQPLVYIQIRVDDVERCVGAMGRGAVFLCPQIQVRSFGIRIQADMH
jgi:hypothetical protein